MIGNIDFQSFKLNMLFYCDDYIESMKWYCNDFPGGSAGKASACNVGHPGLIPGSGRPPGEGNGNPPHDSCLENSMDGGAW